MFNAANILIEARLRNNWTETLIDWDNVEFNPVRGTPFVRLQTEWVDTVVKGVNGRSRGEGYINLSVFVQLGTGTNRITEMASDLSDIFNRWDNGSLKFGVARIMRIGEQEQWYRLDVIVPFIYDECN